MPLTDAAFLQEIQRRHDAAGTCVWFNRDEIMRFEGLCGGLQYQVLRHHWRRKKDHDYCMRRTDVVKALEEGAALFGEAVAKRLKP